MMIWALVALAAGAVAGVYLATRHFMRKRLPATVALLHGLGGATGFTLVLLVVVREPSYRPIRDVLYLLIATVLLGVVNLLFHVRRVRHRTSLIVMHGLTAVTSAAMLIRAIVIYAPPAEAATAPAPPSAQVATAAAPPAGDALAPRAAEPAPTPAAPVEPAAPGAQPARKPAADEFRVDGALQAALARSINFETNRATISQGSHAEIAELAKVIQDHPEIGLLEIQGHADERGDDHRNVELTRARAAAVMNALVARGVARARLRSAGYGARCPADPACQGDDALASCHTPAAWERDRRVAVLVLRIGETSFRGDVTCPRAGGSSG